MILLRGPKFSKWPKLAGVLVNSMKSLRSLMSGLKSLSIEKETFSTRNNSFPDLKIAKCIHFEQ